MKYLYITLLFSFCLGTAFAQDAKKDYTEALQLVEVWLDAQKDFDQLPGLSAIVVEDQDVLWSGAVGLANVADKVSTQPSTLCSICSISKLFTSVAIMKLYDEGKLRLDDRISDLLPQYDLKQQYAASGPITVRSLLTHSSGLPREADAPYWTAPEFDFPTTDEVDAGLKNQETLYPASTYFQYSNLGLTLLGEIVTEVSGMPYETYVAENILKPLGLTDTRTELPEALYGSELAFGYNALDRSGNRDKLNFFQANGIMPAAGFSSNVTDLGKFASWQLRLRDTTTTEVLKPSTLKLMQQVHFTDPNWKTTWGLGFVVYKGSNGNTWVGHGGSCPGYRTALQIDLKRKLAFSVMINASATNPGKYINGINGIISKVKETEKTDESEQPVDLSEYTGYYNTKPWWSELYIGTWGDKLVTLNLPADDPAEAMTMYKHIAGDTFRKIREDKELGETLTFERDAAGKIIRYKQHGNYSVKFDPHAK